MKKVILILTFCSFNILYAFEDASTTLYNMKINLETQKESLYNVSINIRRDIQTQRQELIKIENGLDVVLKSLKVFKSSFTGCYNDYDDSIKGFREIRDDTIRRYPHKREQLTNTYYEDIEEAKDELKTCLSSKGDFLTELKALRTRLDDMKEAIDTSRKSIPRLEKRLNKVNKKILRITAEINAIEGKS